MKPFAIALLGLHVLHVAAITFTTTNDGTNVAPRGFVGCYYSRDADATYSGSYYYRNDTEADEVDSPTDCLTHCAGLGYSYFGLVCPTTSEITCFCSNDLPQTELDAEECSGGTLTTATGCGSSQGVCTGVTASSLYAHEGYFVGGCEREAVYMTEQRAIATCTLTTPGDVAQVVIDAVDLTPFLMGSSGSYTISFDGSATDIALKMDGADCSSDGIQATCACSTCVTDDCSDCLWEGFEISNDNQYWRGLDTDTELDGAWYLPTFDFSDWFYPWTAASGVCFGNTTDPTYWYILGGPQHFCEHEQCKVCTQEELSDIQNPRCFMHHPSDVDIAMDPDESTSLSLTVATATCTEGAGSADITCGDYTAGILAEETCTDDPAVDYTCDVLACDFTDAAGNCYRYNSIAADFRTAESTCLSRGGHVAFSTDLRVWERMVDHVSSLQEIPELIWFGVVSKDQCDYKPIDGSLPLGGSPFSRNWIEGDPVFCSDDGGCAADWDTTQDQDCCVTLTLDTEWHSRVCTLELPFFCASSATSRYPDVKHVDYSITCDVDETVCRPDSFSANGRMDGSECIGSCDESCQTSGGCEFDTDCDDCDVCDEGGCDDPDCDEDGCDGAGCDDASCDEGSCDAAGCDQQGCDTKGCDQPSCDSDSCDYASCDVQSCDAKGCDAAGCDDTSCDSPSCDSTSCDLAGCDANSCDDPACDEASCDLGGCDLGGCDDPSCDEASCDREECSNPSCDDKSCDAGGCDNPSCDENGCDLGGCDAAGCDGAGCDEAGCDSPSCDRDCDLDCLADSGVCDSGEVCDTPDNTALPEDQQGSCDFDEDCDGISPNFDEGCDNDSSCDDVGCTNGVYCDGDEECDAADCLIDGTGCDSDEDCDADDGCDATACSVNGGEACDNEIDCTTDASYCDGDEECDALNCEAGTCDNDESCDDDESCDADACAKDYALNSGGVCDGDESCVLSADCDATACAANSNNCDDDEGCDASSCALDVTNTDNCDSDESCDATACDANEAVCDEDESCDGFIGPCSANGLSGSEACDGDESCDDDAGCDYDVSCDKDLCTFIQGDTPGTSAYNTTTCDQDESCDFDDGCDKNTCNGGGFCDGDEQCDVGTCETGGYCDDNDEGCDLAACELDDTDCDGDELCDGWVTGLCEDDINNCDLDEECDAGWSNSPCDQYPSPTCDGDESCDLDVCEAEYVLADGLSSSCDGDEECDLDESCDMDACELGGTCDGDEECDQTSCEGHGLSAKEYEDTYGNLNDFNSSYCDGDELCDFDEACDNTACDESIDMTACDLTLCEYGNFCDDDEECDFDGGCDNNGGCDFDEQCDFDESCDYDDGCDVDESCDWDEGCDLDLDSLGSCDRSCDTATCDETECDLCSGDCRTCSSCENCEEDCPSGQYRQGCGGTSEGTCVACRNILDGYYFNSNGRLRDECQTVECSVDCPIGQYNDECEFTTSDDTNCVDCTPTPGYYFIENGGLTDSCTAALCNLDCPRGQYLSGCEGTNPGECTNCTRLPDGHFFTTNGLLLDNCEYRPCFVDCPVGQYNIGCNGTNPGVCTNCTAPPAGYYFLSNGGQHDACEYESCTVTTTCPVGQFNYGCDQTTTPGECRNCTNAPDGYYYSGNAGVTDSCEVTECTLECSVGQYNAGCSGTTDPTQCAECDKPDDGFFFTSAGDYRSDSCSTAACVADCPRGQFKGSCDGLPGVEIDSVLVGGICTNCSLPPIGYYLSGAGTYYDNCPSVLCEGCDVGFYRSGCDGTTSPGTCEACNVTAGSYLISSGTNDDIASCTARECQDDCPIGMYKTGCFFTDPGSCQNCTDLPHGFHFISNGNFEDNCAIKHGRIEYNLTLGNILSGSTDPNEIYGSDWSVIGVGIDNTIAATKANVIAGGSYNTVNGAWGTIAGGYGNSVYSKASYGTVAAGRENVAAAKFATIGAGRLNRAFSNYATVVGGYGNKASGKFATVVGGSRNTASGLRSSAMGYLSFALASNSMAWGFDSSRTTGCKVEKTDESVLQVCTQSFLVNGVDFLTMLDSDAESQANICADSPGDGVTTYCQQQNLEAGTECVIYLDSCAGSGRATVICEEGDSSALGSGAQWSDPICLECPSDGCYGQSCEYYLPGGDGGGAYTCDILESRYSCDCAACDCGSRRLHAGDGARPDVKESVKAHESAAPCDRDNIDCGFSAFAPRHEELSQELELKLRLTTVKQAYHTEMVKQHKYLQNVTELMDRLERMKKQMSKLGEKTSGAQSDEIKTSSKRSKAILAPQPAKTTSPTPSPLHPTPLHLQSTSTSSKVNPYDKEGASHVEQHRQGRRQLATRKDQIEVMTSEASDLLLNIAVLGSQGRQFLRLPAEASTPSGSCSDPSVVYDGTNVYICDGSSWTTLTPA